MCEDEWSAGTARYRYGTWLESMHPCIDHAESPLVQLP